MSVNRDEPDNRLQAWAGAFCLNLIVPFPLSFMMCRSLYSLFGVFLALISLFVLTAWIVRWFRSLGRWLVIGAWIVACTQLFPCLHFYSFGMSERVCDYLKGAVVISEPDPVIEFACAFIFTWLAAQALLLCAFMFGLPTGLLLDYRRGLVFEPEIDEDEA